MSADHPWFDCKCAICRNSSELALKIVVHTGTAVFHQISGFNKVSGPDVILAHRLLKNSVPEKEYLLMSEAAYNAIGQRAIRGVSISRGVLPQSGRE